MRLEDREPRPADGLEHARPRRARPPGAVGREVAEAHHHDAAPAAGPSGDRLDATASARSARRARGRGPSPARAARPCRSRPEASAVVRASANRNAPKPSRPELARHRHEEGERAAFATISPLMRDERVAAIRCDPRAQVERADYALGMTSLAARPRPRRGGRAGRAPAAMLGVLLALAASAGHRDGLGAAGPRWGSRSPAGVGARASLALAIWRYEAAVALGFLLSASCASSRRRSTPCSRRDGVARSRGASTCAPRRCGPAARRRVHRVEPARLHRGGRSRAARRRS